MLVNSFQNANTENTNYCQWQQKNDLKVMIIDQRKAHVFISSLLIAMSKQQFSAKHGCLN